MRRLPIYILIDTSGSMKGEPIESVKVGLGDMIASLRLDPYALETVYISVITYDHDVRQILPLTELEDLQLPEIELSSADCSNLGATLNMLCDCYDREVNMGSREQKGDWMPLLFLITDGSPKDLIVYKEAIKRIKQHQFGYVVVYVLESNVENKLLQQLTNNILPIDTIGKFRRWWCDLPYDGGIGINDQDKEEYLLPPPPTKDIIII